MARDENVPCCKTHGLSSSNSACVGNAISFTLELIDLYCDWINEGQQASVDALKKLWVEVDYAT